MSLSIIKTITTYEGMKISKPMLSVFADLWTYFTCIILMIQKVEGLIVGLVLN